MLTMWFVFRAIKNYKAKHAEIVQKVENLGNYQNNTYKEDRLLRLGSK